MTIHRAKRPITIDLAPGVSASFAYGDLVDVDGAVLESLIANGDVEATNIVLPENDPTPAAEYDATHAVLEEIALTEQLLDKPDE